MNFTMATSMEISPAEAAPANLPAEVSDYTRQLDPSAFTHHHTTTGTSPGAEEAQDSA